MSDVSHVLAFAGEVCSHPAMLRDWANEFGGDPRIRLTICARRGDAQGLHARLDETFAGLEPSVRELRRQIRETVVPPDSGAEQALVEDSVAYYSFRRRPAPFSHLPRIGRGDFRALRTICGAFKDTSDEPVGPPDFIGVAAQKSGTTWWCELIYRHPRVHRSPRFRKEARFFSTFRGFQPDAVPVEKYASLFPRPAGTIIGEWTPDYLWDPGCAAMLERAAPKARILALLRDPVERYISGLTHRVMYREPVGTGADDMAFEAGLYAKQLGSVLESFPREQILVLQYERCCLDPAGQLARTYRFLGLDPDFVPEGLSVPIHATHIDKVQVPDQTRQQLIEAYRDDCVRLVEWFPDVDLDLWTTLRTAPTESTT